MSTVSLSGRELAAQIRERAASTVRGLAEREVFPRLAVVVATSDEATASYVGSIVRSAAKVRIAADVVDLGPAVSAEDIRDTLHKLSGDPTVHGIILQTPLPAGLSATGLAVAIDPAKDVDGANPLSLGRLLAGQRTFAPATAQAVLALLDHHQIDLAGKRVVVVGRSTVVGKPVAQLLLGRDATVTVCHSRTRELAWHTRGAEVLVVAAGRARMITGEHVRPDAVVIDVGTNPEDSGGIVGDVDSASVTGIAGALTPVPGGVGPVTSALLLGNTAEAARWLGAP
ncbi:MAG TPA: tetrahydrofolate dehydrogenase/cyclohydrolase catalytic domain-containing protein [Sporichthyaceae bacterium]|jgi:methylenetetrahydrofolate dehydrogenase (NADP+)/methenyltetrahydrofolate cyclohydrolase|nr:tetrahydrofolate dehydrogenase/cyclohydrolase catalytic domain-containing protein [Sporichthyaceae bacterium]